MDRAARVLAAGALVAAGRVCGAGGGAVPGGDGRTAGTRHVGGDGPDGGIFAGRGRPLRPAAGARLPPPLAAGRDDRGGVGVRGAARTGGDRGLCGDIQPSGVGGLVVAGA